MSSAADCLHNELDVKTAQRARGDIANSVHPIKHEGCLYAADAQKLVCRLWSGKPEFGSVRIGGGNSTSVEERRRLNKLALFAVGVKRIRKQVFNGDSVRAELFKISCGFKRPRPGTHYKVFGIKHNSR